MRKAPGAAPHAAPRAADDRSVDMSEGKDPGPVPKRRQLVAAAARLSPVQEAWAAYVRHANHCHACRTPGGGPCIPAEELWRAFRRQGDVAYARLEGAQPGDGSSSAG